MCFRVLFFLIFITSCNSIENIDVSKLDDPCKCLNAKLEIYQKLNVLYNESFESIGHKNTNKLNLDFADEFSTMLKLTQKLEEIDFKIQLNFWETKIKDCPNYSTFELTRQKFN